MVFVGRGVDVLVGVTVGVGDKVAVGVSVGSTIIDWDKVVIIGEIVPQIVGQDT